MASSPSAPGRGFMCGNIDGCPTPERWLGILSESESNSPEIRVRITFPTSIQIGIFCQLDNYNLLSTTTSPPGDSGDFGSGWTLRVFCVLWGGDQPEPLRLQRS